MVSKEDIESYWIIPSDKQKTLEGFKFVNEKGKRGRQATLHLSGKVIGGIGYHKRTLVEDRGGPNPQIFKRMASEEISNNGSKKKLKKTQEPC